MRKILLPSLIIAASAVSLTSLFAEGLVHSSSTFYYKQGDGSVASAGVIRHYWNSQIVHPYASIDPRLDKTMVRAATLAEERANAESRAHCWQYVKQALLESGAVDSYPKTSYACQAGDELARNYGFTKLSVRDPYEAPVGAVIVYGQGSNGAGHVELRTRDGFVSDYFSKYRCKYPVIAVYAKLSS